MDSINEVTSLNISGDTSEEENINFVKVNSFLKGLAESNAKFHLKFGESDFSELSSSGVVYVDKTMLISDIIEREDKLAIITRPSRWGKTTNLDMLAKFFAMEVDEQGILLQSTYKELFSRLEIGQKCRKLVEMYQGIYPVIFFGFKSHSVKLDELNLR